MKRSLAQQIADASAHSLAIYIRASTRTMRNQSTYFKVSEFNKQMVDDTVVTTVYFIDGSKLVYTDDVLDDATDAEA